MNMEDIKKQLQSIVQNLSRKTADYPLDNYDNWRKDPKAKDIMFFWSGLVYAQGFLALLTDDDYSDETLKLFCACFQNPERILSNPQAKDYLLEMMHPIGKPEDGEIVTIFHKYRFPVNMWYKKNRTHHFDLDDILGCCSLPY